MTGFDAPPPGSPAPSGKPAAVRRCPICRAPTTERHRPFCSARCADVDLNRWLGGVYAIPTAEPESIPDLDDDSRDRD